jgi:hypothetical protein
MINWDRADATVRQAFRKNGRDYEQVRSRTPLSDLIAKDPVPDMDEMTEQMLCEFAADHHVAIPEGLSREELIETIKAALLTNWEERLRGMVQMLDYFYEDGPHPISVYRRVSGVTKAIRPKLLMNMSAAQLAVLCDDGKGRTCDGRATVVARIKRLFNEPIKKTGMRGFKAPFQKTEDAGHSYSGSAQGNQNRRGRDFLEHAPKRKRKAA